MVEDGRVPENAGGSITHELVGDYLKLFVPLVSRTCHLLSNTQILSKVAQQHLRTYLISGRGGGVLGFRGK